MVDALSNNSFSSSSLNLRNSSLVNANGIGPDWFDIWCKDVLDIEWFELVVWVGRLGLFRFDVWIGKLDLFWFELVVCIGRLDLFWFEIVVWIGRLDLFWFEIVIWLGILSLCWFENAIWVGRFGLGWFENAIWVVIFGLWWFGIVAWIGRLGLGLSELVAWMGRPSLGWSGTVFLNIFAICSRGRLETSLGTAPKMENINCPHKIIMLPKIVFYCLHACMWNNKFFMRQRFGRHAAGKKNFVGKKCMFFKLMNSRKFLQESHGLFMYVSKKAHQHSKTYHLSLRRWLQASLFVRCKEKASSIY